MAIYIELCKCIHVECESIGMLHYKGAFHRHPRIPSLQNNVKHVIILGGNKSQQIDSNIVFWAK
jgi:hypothetical protein